MKTTEKIVYSIFFIIGIIIISISAYNLYQSEKEYKEIKAQQKKELTQQQKAEQQKILQEQKAEQQKILQEQKAEQQRIEQGQKITKLFISQLNKKNINNIPLGNPALIGEGKYKHDGIYSWKFIIDDDALYSYIVKPINGAIGKEKYNKENSTLCIEIVRDNYDWYVFCIQVDLNKFTADDYYVNFNSGIVLDKEMMDNTGIVLW
jgi:hypothetical protein